MQGIPLEERKRLGALLDTRPQTEVMAMISQFSQAETDNFVAPPAQVPKALGVLMFNMERGVNLPEIQEFLRDCPDIQPFDVILANELDDGCARSGNKNTARELAQAFGLNYAWGLEFIELVNDENAKGFHGNAVFSRWPIRRAGVIRLPEQYNWYFDRQKRIGGPAGGLRGAGRWRSAGGRCIHPSGKPHPWRGPSGADGCHSGSRPRGAARYAPDPRR